MDRPNTIIIYGSYGYTGSLIAAECRAKNIAVVLAGRNEDALQLQNKLTGYPYEVVDLADAAALKKLLLKGKLVIHCAGPFQHTANEMVKQCLESETHYTDITGEHQVFEQLAGYSEQAKAAGIMIMPGTGFDVVPSDCLALYLKKSLPTATKLILAFKTSQGGLSRGTARTMIEGLGAGSVIREGGKLITTPIGSKVKQIDFGSFQATCLNIPWGDVSTAWFSTGIPNIEVYMATNKRTILLARISAYFNWLLRSAVVKNFLLKMVDKKISGPDHNRRQAARSFLWGQVSDDSGNNYTATIETLNGYSLTAKTSVLIAEKILGNDFKPGFQTPSMAYGADLILEIEGTVRSQHQIEFHVQR